MLGGMIQNLQGLQSFKANQVKMDEFQTQQMNRKKAADLLRSYQETQDPAKLNEAILLDSDLSQNVLTGIGIQDKARGQKAAADYIELTGAMANKDLFNQVAARRVNDILRSGGDPKDTLALVKTYNEQGPEAARVMAQPIGAALVNQGYLRPELFSGGQPEQMTAFQQASTDLRKQELEFNKQQKATETQLKVLEARMRKEDNELKRQDLQLKIDEQQQKLTDMKTAKETAKREKSAELNQALFGIDNMLNTVAKIEQSESLNDVVGTIEGRMDAYLSDDAAATIRLIENLGSQAFMAMIPGLKGMGALSNAEGDKLAASLQNLSRVTGEDQFRSTLKEVTRLMNKSRKFISERYGAAETNPDTPAAEPSETDILKQYGLE